MRGVSVITWCNDMDTYMQFMLTSMTSPYQMGHIPTQFIVVPPESGARNMGHAYNMARAQAIHSIRLYIHQDVKIHDRHFLEKLNYAFLDPKMGGVGIIGSSIDTGAAHFNTIPRNRVGILHGAFYPQRQKVKLVDGFLFATNIDLPWSEKYEGPHMAVEDMCMRVRGKGKQIWTLDVLSEHKSGGKCDPAFWRSVKIFRKRWRKALPKDMPSLKYLKANNDMCAEFIQTPVNVEMAPSGPNTPEAASG
jgi:hypothetical protein